MARVKKDLLFNAVTVFILIALAFVLYVMVTAGGATNSNTGKAKLVLEITGYTYGNFIGPGHIRIDYPVHALHSSDPAIREGADFPLLVYGTGFETGDFPEELERGTIIGISDYSIQDNVITVSMNVSSSQKNTWDSAWRQKITVIHQAASSYTF